mmetsp:Transcript_144559/g.463216  ORF Transcript_144559/g.463216 Transcript_144559/m.463216 type:complete len:486 (+) Transcript_144559:674-2131(+)
MGGRPLRRRARRGLRGGVGVDRRQHAADIDVLRCAFRAIASDLFGVLLQDLAVRRTVSEGAAHRGCATADLGVGLRAICAVAEDVRGVEDQGLAGGAAAEGAALGRLGAAVGLVVAAALLLEAEPRLRGLGVVQRWALHEPRGALQRLASGGEDHLDGEGDGRAAAEGLQGPLRALVCDAHGNRHAHGQPVADLRLVVLHGNIHMNVVIGHDEEWPVHIRAADPAIMHDAFAVDLLVHLAHGAVALLLRDPQGDGEVAHIGVVQEPDRIRLVLNDGCPCRVAVLALEVHSCPRVHQLHHLGVVDVDRLSIDLHAGGEHSAAWRQDDALNLPGDVVGVHLLLGVEGLGADQLLAGAGGHHEALRLDDVVEVRRLEHVQIVLVGIQAGEGPARGATGIRDLDAEHLVEGPNALVQLDFEDKWLDRRVLERLVVDRDGRAVQHVVLGELKHQSEDKRLAIAVIHEDLEIATFLSELRIQVPLARLQSS